MTANWLDLYCTLTTAHLYRGEDVRKQQTQFLYFPTCLPGVKFTLTVKWRFLHFLICFPNWEVFHDKKKKTDSVSTLYNMYPCRSHCIMTENWLSFYILQLASPLLSVLWQKTGPVSIFSNVLSLRELFRDRKSEKFLHFPMCFPVVQCSVTENWLSFYIFQCVSLSWSVPWQQTESVSTLRLVP